MSSPAGSDPTVERIVEILCNEGCEAVNQYITGIETGNCPTCMHSMTPAQQQLVLSELKKIMTVYSGKS